MKRNLILAILCLLLVSLFSAGVAAFYYDFDYGHYNNYGKYTNGYYRNMAGYSPGWNTYEGMYAANYYSGGHYAGANYRNWYNTRAHYVPTPTYFDRYAGYRPVLSRTYRFY